MKRLPRSDADPSAWSPHYANSVACLEGLELIEEHREVIVKPDSFKEALN